MLKLAGGEAFGMLALWGMGGTRMSGSTFG